MSVFETLVGNKRIKDTLGRDILTGHVRHAYILEGETGSGKHTAALLAAAAVNCESEHRGMEGLPCLKCNSCRKIMGHNAADVITVSRDGKASIGVETVRNLKNDIYISPVEFEYKIYMIEDAHTMTVQAQNAFLLSLESPPPYVIFFLLTSDASLLLQTVRSRAPILKTEHIGSGDILNFLSMEKKFREKSETEQKSIASAASGNIGRGLELLNDKKFSARQESKKIAFTFLKSLCRASEADYFDVIRTLPQKREELIAVIVDALAALRDLTAVKLQSGADTIFFFDSEEAAAECDDYTLAQLLAAEEALTAAAAEIKRNAAISPLLASLYSRVRAS